MKNMKKLVSLLLTLAMVFAMSATVFAATHTYQAYQIFSGTMDAKTNELTNLDWGSGVNSTNLVNALKADDTLKNDFKDATTAAEVAAVLAGYSNESAQMKAFAQVVGANLSSTVAAEGASLNITADGYYFVKDKDGTVSGTDAYTRYIVKASAKTTLTPTPKADVPEVIKKVKENTTVASTVGNTDTNMPNYTIPADYNDVADYNIGDKVPFQIVGTLPTNYDEYTTYYYEFSDTYNKTQFQLDTSSVTVKVGDEVITDKFTLTETTTGFTLICSNIKAIEAITKDSFIVVDYKMTLLAGCEVGAGNGNENKVKLIFSNNPNKDHDGEKGETPEDKVVVFTYDVPVKKIDGTTQNALKDVEFVFQNADGKYVTVDPTTSKVTGWVDTVGEATTFKTGADGKFSIIGLDDGTYSLVETKALPGYNAIDPIEVVVDANTTNTQTWSGTQTDVSSKVNLTANGVEVESTEITIENNSGATLPSTGGRGTTLIYVLGSVLVLGAGVLLVAKKRVER